MESGNRQITEPTVEDPWLLDHHIEEILSTFGEAAPIDESDPDAAEQRLA